MRKILVVEDEDAIREVVALNLRLAGYEVTEAASAEQALAVFSPSAGFDVAVLDIMLPGMNGFSLCETIRRDSASIGIIMLSAKTLETDKINGLSIGADDYMTKPFSVSELLARVEALVRRVGRQGASSAAPEPDGRMVSGVFVLDQKSRVLYKNGTPIDLTQVEFQIMELFFANPGVALVREKILEGVWGENYFGDVKIVDVNIRRLRMKIEDEPSAPKHILTVWGYGYRWNAIALVLYFLWAEGGGRVNSITKRWVRGSLLVTILMCLCGGGRVPVLFHHQLLRRRAPRAIRRAPAPSHPAQRNARPRRARASGVLCAAWWSNLRKRTSSN